MKLFFLYCCLFCFSIAAFANHKLQEVNAVLHDQSFVARFGFAPDKTISEQVRIQTHLLYAEHLLRSASGKGLTELQKLNRLAILDLLHKYQEAGNFPVNRDYPSERRPCFIDADGAICAVGYLIEQTRGHALAESINKNHQYDFITDMNEPAIAGWANEFGLTLKECAMIQPAYGPPSGTPAMQDQNIEIKKEYGIASAFLGGANITISVTQLSARGKYHPALSYTGLVTGSGQIIMGIINIKKTTTVYWIDGGKTTTSYKQQNNLSYINIALGTTTILSSAFNLLINKKNKEKRSVFKLYSYPNSSNSVTMGLSFMRRV